MAERKQVTVLFTDVVHSMDIVAAVGAERLRENMTELVNRVSSFSTTARNAVFPWLKKSADRIR